MKVPITKPLFAWDESDAVRSGPAGLAAIASHPQRSDFINGVKPPELVLSSRKRNEAGLQSAPEGRCWPDEVPLRSSSWVFYPSFCPVAPCFPPFLHSRSHSITPPKHLINEKEFTPQPALGMVIFQEIVRPRWRT